MTSVYFLSKNRSSCSVVLRCSATAKMQKNSKHLTKIYMTRTAATTTTITTATATVTATKHNINTTINITEKPQLITIYINTRRSDKKSRSTCYIISYINDRTTDELHWIKMLRTTVKSKNSSSKNDDYIYTTIYIVLSMTMFLKQLANVIIMSCGEIYQALAGSKVRSHRSCGLCSLANGYSHHGDSMVQAIELATFIYL